MGNRLAGEFLSIHILVFIKVVASLSRFGVEEAKQSDEVKYFPLK